MTEIPDGSGNLFGIFGFEGNEYQEDNTHECRRGAYNLYDPDASLSGSGSAARILRGLTTIFFFSEIPMNHFKRHWKIYINSKIHRKIAEIMKKIVFWHI